MTSTKSLKINQLKEIAKALNLKVVGDKRKKQTWINAIEANNQIKAPTTTTEAQLIKEFDNYIPLYAYRQLLPGNRQEQDQVLFQMSRNDQIELRSLMHGEDYSDEQLAARIETKGGNPLFFVKVLAA